MYNIPPRIQTLALAPGRRVLVVSDIHGNLEYLKGLLKKTAFSDADELIIDGDFLEKGPESLATLRYIMELYKRGNVHPIIGNCDGWDEIFAQDERHDEMTLHYMLWQKHGVLWDMCNASGLYPFAVDSFADCKRELYRIYRPEWDFLASLPHAIETERFIFAHAGVNPEKPLAMNTMQELMKVDAFLRHDYSFDKWVVVGHYPVMLYGKDKVCANPVVERERKIVSIDGACVLKDDGQLNALIIPDGNSDDFSFAAYDHFPLRKVLSDQHEGGRSYYIRWGDSRVQVLERGEEFSHCRHVRTGYEMDILTKYLFTDNEFTDCNDCTDYVLPLKAGDTVSVVEKTSRGFFVKHKGASGWYYGELI